MIKLNKYVVVILLLASNLAWGQVYRAKTIHWKVVDRKICEGFLNKYLDNLTKEERRENQIQASFDLFVTSHGEGLETVHDKSIVIRTV